MTSDRYIVVPNWNDFQHYKDRTPRWIKNYAELLADDAYLNLSGHQRAVLHGLWLEYASARCQLPLDTRSLSSRLQLRVSSRTLEALNHAGFIEFVASKPLAPRYQDASPEVEVEKEKKVSRTLGATWQPALGVRDPAKAVRAMIHNGAIADHVTLQAELRAYGLNGADEQALTAELEQALTAAPPDTEPQQ